jgi:beta propeller repeat protein
MVSTIGYGHVFAAQTTITQVTSNAWEDSFPQIEGDYLVWQGRNNGDWEIVLYEVSGAVFMQITDNGYDDVLPQTDGEYVVWQGFKDGEWDVFLWDGTEIGVISERGAEDVAPRIRNGLVVWTSEPLADGDSGHDEVILYDIGTQISLTLSASVDPGNILDDTSPRIHDQGVSWLQSDDEDNVTTWLYNVSDGTVVANPGQVLRDTPERDGNLTVLTRAYEGGSELFLYSQNLRKSWRITENQVNERYPGTSGEYIVWVAEGEVFLAKVQYIELVSPADHAVLSKRSPPMFSWEAVGYDKFKIEFSKDSGFTATEITLPLESGQELQETSYTPTAGEWELIGSMEEEGGYACWRIKGEDGSGVIAFSETRCFTLDGGNDLASGAGVAETDMPSGGDGDSGSCFINSIANSLAY